jgi:uncharacterized protein DUF3592
MRMELGNLITILFGVCFVAAGAFAYAYMDRFIGTGHEASGVVVEVVYETGSRESRMHPVVRFKTADGREVLGRSGQHYNSAVGQALQLVYDPKNPEHVEIGTLSELRKFRTIVAAICVLSGLVICFIGIGLELGILNWQSPRRRN